MAKKQDIHSKYSGCSQEELLEVIAKLSAENSRLLAYSFGSRRERYVPDPEGMPLLFNEAEELAGSTSEVVEIESDEETDSTKREKKPRGKRKPLPLELPRVQRIVDLPDEEKRCPVHDVDKVKIGEEHREKLELQPAKAFVADYVIYRYKCPCCDDLIVTHGAIPSDPIPKSFASPSLLAYVASQKYADGLPLARQEAIFSRYGIELNRTTLARWMIKLGELVSPLISLLHDDLLVSEVVHADETHVQVLKEPNKRPESQSYMWCLARSGSSPIVFFRYYDNRSKRAAADLLSGFKGVLVADAYKVYDSLQATSDFTLSGCFAHARRRFVEAEKFGKNLSLSERALAPQALVLIKKLYALEKKFKSLDPEQKLEQRKAFSVPILQRLHEWMLAKKDDVLPRSLIGKAIHYALSQWEKLTVFCRDGRVPIDNNFLESHIKPFAVGRNAWMFSAVQAGANASANLYTLVESAKANGIEPYGYLELIIKELSSSTTLEQLEKLLPHFAAKHYSLRPHLPSKKDVLGR